MTDHPAIPAPDDGPYRSLFNAIPEPTWVFDLETLRFLEVNDAACARYGWSRDEFLAMTLRDIRPPEDLAKLQASVSEVNAATPARGSVHRHVDKSGNVFPVRISGAPHQFDGRPARLVVAHDIGELERLNATLEQRVADRTESLRLAVAELEWFTESVSHDLKDPVRNVRALATDLLARAANLGDADRESALRIVGASGRLENLVDDLLALARQRADAPADKPVSLILVLSEMLGQVRRDLGFAGIRANAVTIVEPLYYVRAHRPTLNRIASELLRLAISSGDVTVSAQSSQGRISLRIDCGHLPASADPDDRSAPLSMAIRSAKRLGGTLHLQSPTQQRTTLLLNLPEATPA